jgi:DNA-binding FadR family transcriptional regulator
LASLIKEQEERLTIGGNNIIDPNSAFHGHLARMTKNPVLKRILYAIIDLLKQIREDHLQNTERAKKSFLGHREIFTAIKNGDCTAARRSMQRHLEDVEKILTGRKRI